MPSWPALRGKVIAFRRREGVPCSSRSSKSEILVGLAHNGPDGPSILYDIDPLTGSATAVGPVGFDRCSGMDFDASGTLYATCEQPADPDQPGSFDLHVLITIDPLTGAGTEVGPTGVESLEGPFPFNTAADLSFRDSDNKLFAYTFPGDALATLDLTTGAMTQLGFPSGVIEGSGYGLAFSPGDTLLLAVGKVLADSHRLWTLDQVTSAAQSFILLSEDGSSDRINGMDFEPATGTVFASFVTGFGGSRQNSLATVDVATGTVTILGPTAEGLDAVAFFTDAKPTLTLLIDEDSISSGTPPNYFLDTDVNKDIAEIGLRTQLPFFANNVDSTITLHTGEVGDEGWFVLKTVPDTWVGAGPTDNGLRNFLGNPSQPFPHNVGPGLGSGDDPEELLDKIPDITPLRATGLKGLEGQHAVVPWGDTNS